MNQPLPEDRFEALRDKVVAHLDAGELYVVDAFAGADPAHRIAVRVVTGRAYHALFAKTMFIEPTADELAAFRPQALVLHAPGVEADPEVDGTRTGTFVVLHPTRTEILIGGTFYAGEIKKGIFTVMNDRLPLEGVLPMHCSANVDDAGRVAVFFGLSGTGKTTLSADPERHLIGDDEHGWGDSGVFNVEGGCYAKVIRLSAEAEPQIYATTRHFGTILENVAVDDSGVLDLDDDSKTENTRAAYKLEEIANALPCEARRASERGRDADRRRVRRPAADREADARPGDVLLPVRIHGQGRGHRDRRHRAAGDVLDLFRRAVPAAAAGRLRAHARREARPRIRTSPSGSSTPAGRAGRSGKATGCRSPPRVRSCARRSRAVCGTSSTGSIRCSASRCRRACPASTPRCSTRARPGPTPRPTTREAADLARMFRDNFAQFADTVDAAVVVAGPGA